MDLCLLYDLLYILFLSLLQDPRPFPLPRFDLGKRKASPETTDTSQGSKPLSWHLFSMQLRPLYLISFFSSLPLLPHTQLMVHTTKTFRRYHGPSRHLSGHVSIKLWVVSMPLLRPTNQVEEPTQMIRSPIY